MAKTAKPEETPDEATNVSSVETKEDTVIVAEKAPVMKVAEVKEVEVKKVKIHTLDEINSLIAQVSYVFKKDKDVEVPSDVAAILVKGKKAYRI